MPQIFGSPNYSTISALDYTDYWNTRGFHMNPRLKEREEIMRDMVPPGSKVLDIGCGTSRLPLVLTEKGCHVEVGDVSPIVLEGFKAVGIPARTIDLNHPADAKFEGKYDVIIMSEVLEHLTNPEEVISVLSPHTKQFLLTIPNTGFYAFRFRLLFGRVPKQWVYHPSEHVRFWTHVDFLEWLSAQNLRVEEFKPSNGFSCKGLLPWLKDVWPNLLGHQIVYVCTPKREANA